MIAAAAWAGRVVAHPITSQGCVALGLVLGWALVTWAIVRLTSSEAWLFSGGLFLLSLVGWRFIGVLFLNGLYALSVEDDE